MNDDPLGVRQSDDPLGLRKPAPPQPVYGPTPVLRAAPESDESMTIGGIISSLFGDKSKESAKAANAITLSEATGLPISVVYDRMDEITQEMGLRDQPPFRDLIEKPMMGAVVGGLMAHPLATAVGVGAFGVTVGGTGISLSAGSINIDAGSYENVRFNGQILTPKTLFENEISRLEGLIAGLQASKANVGHSH